MFHLELLQNIDRIPLVVQYTLKPILYPVVCGSNSFFPVLPLPPSQVICILQGLVVMSAVARQKGVWERLSEMS